MDKGENDEDYIKWIPFGGEEADPHVEKVLELNIFMQTLNIDTSKRVNSVVSSGQSKGEETE